MIFVDQSYTTLNLTIYSGDIDLSELQILKQQKVSITPDLQLQAGIIGASHFIKIQYKDRYFTEVFACANIEEAHYQKLYHAPFTQLHPLTVKGLPNLTYQFNHQFCQLEQQEQINAQLAQRIASLSSKGIHLSFTFPSSAVSSLAPRTVVVVDVDEDCSTIRTFTIHEYPEEGVIVTNESSFVVRIG